MGFRVYCLLDCMYIHSMYVCTVRRYSCDALGFGDVTSAKWKSEIIPGVQVAEGADTCACSCGRGRGRGRQRGLFAACIGLGGLGVCRHATAAADTAGRMRRRQTRQSGCW